MKTAAIIQARMGSTRLPGKVLMDIAGKPMLQHVIERAQAIRGVDLVIVATTNQPADVAVMELAASCAVAAYGGDEQDVLSRFFCAAVIHGADTIIRLTGDCPLLDPIVASHVLMSYLVRSHKALAYVSNVFPTRTWPRGYDTEVFSRQVLVEANQWAIDEYDREHVTPWMQRECIPVNVRNPNGDESLVNLSVDTEEDLERVRTHVGVAVAHPG